MSELVSLFAELTTPHVADGCLKRGIQVRFAPFDLRPLSPLNRGIAGVVRPARHYGSVDVFLESLESARPGDVLVIDNGGRTDEACIGDLIVLEAKAAGLAGVVVWGLHRDTRELQEIALPIFSLGASPTGPLRLDNREPEALESARVGPWVVAANDMVVADENGVLFVPIEHAEEVAAAARLVRDTERDQADKMRHGTTLRAQLRFSEFLSKRALNAELTFRQHLRRIGGAVEE